MDDTQVVNQRVDVVCSYKSKGNMQTVCFPYKMRWKNQEVTFKELCFRHPTLKGQRMIHVFDMSDGSRDYRLEYDAEGLTWTLKEILFIR